MAEGMTLQEQAEVARNSSKACWTPTVWSPVETRVIDEDTVEVAATATDWAAGRAARAPPWPRCKT